MEFVFNRIAGLQTITRLNTPPHILFWKKGKDIPKIQDLSNKVRKNVPFPVTLETLSPELSTSKNKNLKKNISCECSKMVGNLPRKGL